MTLADDLGRERSALRIINPSPYNAEAPPEALTGDITATGLHYVRSNFAVFPNTTARSTSEEPSNARSR